MPDYRVYPAKSTKFAHSREQEQDLVTDVITDLCVECGQQAIGYIGPDAYCEEHAMERQVPDQPDEEMPSEIADAIVGETTIPPAEEKLAGEILRQIEAGELENPMEVIKRELESLV